MGTGTQTGKEKGMGNDFFPEFEGVLAAETSPSTQTWMFWGREIATVGSFNAT